MASRRITLTSQEMNEITKQTSTLQSQLHLSNERVDELEKGLGVIDKLINRKTKPKNVDTLCVAVQKLINKAVNPPVKAKAPTALSH